MLLYGEILSSIKIVFLFPYLLVIFSHITEKKSIFKVFKYYCLIQNVKRQFLEVDTENGGDRFSI